MDSTLGYDMDNAIGYLIGHAAMRLKIGLRRLFVASGLNVTPEQWVVLFRLHEKEGLTQSELGERTVKDKTTITRILDRLEKKDMASRRRDARDRRAQRIFLTEKGLATLDALMPLVRRYADGIFGEFVDEERAVLRGLLMRVEARLDAVLEPKEIA